MSERACVSENESVRARERESVCERVRARASVCFERVL